MNICKNCKFCKIIDAQYYCRRLWGTQIDNVTGEPIYKELLCRTEREVENIYHCSTLGRFFEPKVEFDGG